MLVLMLISVVLASTTRILLVRFYRQWIEQGVFGDSAYHYCIIRSLCKQPRPYEGVPEFLLKNGPDRCPVLFHRFASLFGLRIVERFPYLPNLLIFSGFVGILPLLISLIPDFEQTLWLDLSPLGRPLINNHVLSLLTVVLVVTGVSNNSLRGDGILFLSLSERLLAKFSVGLYFFTAALWHMSGENLFLLVSVLTGCVAMSTAKFSRQAIFFTTPLWALMEFDIAILLPLASVLTLLFSFERKNFLLSLRDQWDFSTSYKKYTAKSRVFVSALSKFSILKNTDSLRTALIQLISYEPGKSLIRHPDLLLVLVIGWGEWPEDFKSLILATILIYILTTTKFFRHFGESERYIDYNLAFSLPFMVASEVISRPVDGEGGGILIIALSYRLILIAIALWRDVGRAIGGSESLSEILKQAQIIESSRVLPLPINFGQTISARTGSSVVCYPGVYGAWIFERYIDEYPLLKRPIERLVKEFQITHIVLNKTQTDQFAKIVGWSYDLSRYKKAAENDYWSCYHV